MSRRSLGKGGHFNLYYIDAASYYSASQNGDG
jgi:hypothetical protein